MLAVSLAFYLRSAWPVLGRGAPSLSPMSAT